MDINAEELKRKSVFIRRQVLEMIASAGKGHIGGAFSCTDILVYLFYGGVLRYNAENPQWPLRDRFIMSKGHSGAVQFAILADLGFFPEPVLKKYQKSDCILGGHPDILIPGIEADTGSLGHGLGIGAGLALSARMDGKDFLTFVVMGDGECCEGAVWESAMFSARHNLSNLIGIIDKNELCVTDRVSDCVKIDPLGDKWRAFGWEVKEIDGHSFVELSKAFADIRCRKSDKPLMIVARTVKGKGVSFMEGQIPWHHSVPKGEKLETARKELDIREV